MVSGNRKGDISISSSGNGGSNGSYSGNGGRIINDVCVVLALAQHHQLSVHTYNTM